MCFIISVSQDSATFAKLAGMPTSLLLGLMFVGVALFPTDKVMMWISSKLTRVPYYIGLLHINLLKTRGINF